MCALWNPFTWFGEDEVALSTAQELENLIQVCFTTNGPTTDAYNRMKECGYNPYLPENLVYQIGAAHVEDPNPDNTGYPTAIFYGHDSSGQPLSESLPYTGMDFRSCPADSQQEIVSSHTSNIYTSTSASVPYYPSCRALNPSTRLDLFRGVNPYRFYRASDMIIDYYNGSESVTLTSLDTINEPVYPEVNLTENDFNYYLANTRYSGRGVEIDPREQNSVVVEAMKGYIAKYRSNDMENFIIPPIIIPLCDFLSQNRFYSLKGTLGTDSEIPSTYFPLPTNFVFSVKNFKKYRLRVVQPFTDDVITKTVSNTQKTALSKDVHGVVNKISNLATLCSIFGGGYWADRSFAASILLDFGEGVTFWAVKYFSKVPMKPLKMVFDLPTASYGIHKLEDGMWVAQNDWGSPPPTDTVIEDRLGQTTYQVTYSYKRSQFISLYPDLSDDSNERRYMALICLRSVSEHKFIPIVYKFPYTHLILWPSVLAID